VQPRGTFAADSGLTNKEIQMRPIPTWKVKIVLVAAMLMLIGGVCRGQDAPSAAAPPATPASATNRGGAPTPYRAPMSVPSAAGQIQPLRLPSPTVSVAPTPAPSFSSTCDSSGCWGSDGTRYNAAGGALLRPDGKICQNVGGTLQCP
jgi:hypothetical protein